MLLRVLVPWAVAAMAVPACSPPPVITASRPLDAQAPVPAPFRVLAIGLCEDYPEETRTLEAAHRDLRLIRALGVTHLRVGIGWDGVEPERGKFDWSFWDAFIPAAVRDYGITVVPYVCYTPEWAARPPPPDGLPRIWPTSARS
jgi:hypothetical protein